MRGYACAASDVNGLDFLGGGKVLSHLHYGDFYWMNRTFHSQLIAANKIDTVVDKPTSCITNGLSLKRMRKSPRPLGIFAFLFVFFLAANSPTHRTSSEFQRSCQSGLCWLWRVTLISWRHHSIPLASGSLPPLLRHKIKTLHSIIFVCECNIWQVNVWEKGSQIHYSADWLPRPPMEERHSQTCTWYP